MLERVSMKLDPDLVAAVREVRRIDRAHDRAEEKLLYGHLRTTPVRPKKRVAPSPPEPEDSGHVDREAGEENFRPVETEDLDRGEGSPGTL